MLLAQILHALDDELKRLHKLRTILASLQHVPHYPKTKALATQPSPAPVPAPTFTRLPPKREPTRRFRKPQRTEEPPRALSANIPAAPVVIPPAGPKHSQPEPAPVIAIQSGSFAAMIRAAERQTAS